MDYSWRRWTETAWDTCVPSQPELPLTLTSQAHKTSYQHATCQIMKPGILFSTPLCREVRFRSLLHRGGIQHHQKQLFSPPCPLDSFNLPYQHLRTMRDLDHPTRRGKTAPNQCLQIIDLRIIFWIWTGEILIFVVMFFRSY